MFPLKIKQIDGYTFGVKTFYSNFHLGCDYKADKSELYAPFNGTVQTTVGIQGGNTILFRPDNQDILIRFMHLDRFLKTGHVKEGDLIAITDNTGVTTKPHLHIDI